MNDQVVVVIPAYNEAHTIVEVVRGLKLKGFDRIVVVDDGSSDQTGEFVRQQGVVLISHLVNRGVGGALGTGINAALRFSPKVIVTFDADGQHDPDDVPRLIEPIEKGEADMVNGSRLLNPEGMPWYRQVANRIANLVTYVLFGVWTTDSQSGLRAFSRDAATRLQFMSSGMGANSEILAEIVRNNLRFKEVPVKAIYTSYSLSKGQSLDVGLRTMVKLILVKVRRLGL